MKQLLSGVALAAVLAIATPVLAQSNSSGMAPGGSTSSSLNGGGNSTAAAGSYSGTSAAPARHRRARHVTSHRAARHYSGRSARMAPGDTQTQDLNRQELARLQGGSAPASSPAPMMEPDRNSPGPRAGGGSHIRTQ